MPAQQYRHVCFTSFEDDEPKWDSNKCSYLVYGREICPDTGKRHYQGYCEFTKRVTLKSIQQLFPRAHIERRNGSVDQAISYCKKDGIFKEFGSRSNQGARTDLREISNSIATGTMSLHDVALAAPQLFVQYGRGFQQLHSITNRARTNRWRDVRINIVWGSTGTGKTREWFDTYGHDGYRFQYCGDREYWDGYYGEKNVLLDEFACQVPLSVLLQWTDGYPMMLWVKGSHTWANWITFTFISNDSPYNWYSNCSWEKRKAFARRVKSITHFKEDGSVEFDENFAFNNNFVSELE